MLFAAFLALPLLVAAMPPPAYKGRIWSPFPLPKASSVTGRPLTTALARSRRPAPPPRTGLAPQPYHAAPPSWPAAGSASVPLSQASGTRQVGTLPVRVGPVSGHASTPSSVQVSVASHAAAAAAGINGVIMRVSLPSGTPANGQAVAVQLDYSTFAHDIGGGWSSRLRLVELPACVLSDPSVPACRQQTPLVSANDTVAGRLSATVRFPAGTAAGAGVLAPGATTTATSPLGVSAGSLTTASPGTVVLATTSTTAGGQGNYSATPLKPTGTWTVQQGDFGYTYPVTVPPALGGATPQVTLAYDSQSIDGETSGKNTQASWIGDGWSYSPGFITRSYQPCSNDGITNSGDECWGGQNARISLRGHSGRLVKASNGIWHLQGDDGTKIQLLTGAPNGLWSGQYWLVTTADGTKYYFGRNHLPGGNGSDPATNSAWKVPVYSPKSGDPCYSSSSGQASWCQMGWRWNLDYVVGPAGNLTTYHYATETNYYNRGGGQNGGNGTLTSYVRAGHPVSVSYGYTLSGAIGGAQPAAMVDFGTSQRCLTTSTFTNCSYSNLKSTTASHWPDTPYDLICTSSGSCTNYSPSYFSTERLTSITTKVLAGSSYTTVDSYALSQSFPSAGGSTPVMFLNSIQRTGKDGTSISVPPVTFSGEEIDNRVDGLNPPATPLYRPRVDAITTEAGGEITIVYASPACSRVNGTMPSAQDTNTMPCFPVWWTPPGESPILDWFNKSLVSQVNESDQTGAGSPTQVTNYSYLGGAAWRQDPSPVVSNAHRTWNQYRGYAKVKVTTGASPDPVTETVTTYMRGMNGDPTSSGGTTSVKVSDSLGDTYTDSNWLAGKILEVDTYTKNSGTIDTKTVHGPWSYTQTASQSEPSGLANLTAHMEASSRTRDLALLSDGSWRTDTTTTYDNSHAQVTAVDDNPQGSAQTCTATSYATPPSGNPMMVAYPDQVTTVTGAASNDACPAASSGNIVSATRTYYDNSSATLSSLGSNA